MHEHAALPVRDANVSAGAVSPSSRPPTMMDRDAQIRRMVPLLMRHRGLTRDEAIGRLIHLSCDARRSLHGYLLRRTMHTRRPKRGWTRRPSA